MALAAWQRYAAPAGARKFVAVVPTEALARQWVDSISTWLGLSPSSVGLLGAGGDDNLATHDYLVSVVNTAARALPGRTIEEDTMLVVDECHRAGAPTFSQVLETAARFRLGLSATPDRQELDEYGLPIDFDHHVIGRKLGRIVYRFSLKDAREAGWLPTYRLHHHGVSLTADERLEYEAVSRKVKDLQDRLLEAGVNSRRGFGRPHRDDHVASLQRAYVAATGQRKGLLYSATERRRVSVEVVRRAQESAPGRKTLLFHERVNETVAIADQLRELFPSRVALEHSRLPDAQRQEALAAFRAGDAPILVSVKTLIEGVDVPDAEVGISVAASSSVRQRVQSLGRILRRSFEGADKVAEMHLLYVRGTVDELIYEEEDWEDLTGAEANKYWVWELEATTPDESDAPPRTPHPTEDQIYAELGPEPPALPRPWAGVLPEFEFSVDSRGTVSTVEGVVVENPQGVGEMVASVRGSAGGRFFVSPVHRYVVVVDKNPDRETRLVLAGRLAEAFRSRSPDEEPLDVPESSVPGRLLGTMPDKRGGEFKIRQKQGGVIEKRSGGAALFALDENAEDERQVAAQNTLAAWRLLSLPGIGIFVSGDGIVWFLDAGQPRFLARAPGGFLFPEV